MKIRTTTWLWALALIGLASGVSAQVDEGLLWIRVEIPTGDVFGMREDARRLYAASDEIRLDLIIVNPSESDILIDQEKLQSAFGVSMATADGEPVLIAATWPEEGLLGTSRSDTRVPFVRNETLVVEGHRAAYWTLTVRRADGSSFAPGGYRLSWGSAGLANAIRSADGSMWNGRAPDQVSSIGLLIRPPQNPMDEARMHTLEADAAVARGDYQQALAAYQRSLSAAPTDTRTKTMLAFMYLRLNRYQDAIRPLEEVLAGVVGERNLSFVLALAYVGAGDEGNAVRVLRSTAGLPEDRVRAELESSRREVAQRRSRSGR